MGVAAPVRPEQRLPSVAGVEIQTWEPIDDFRVQSCNEDFGIIGGSDSDLIENLLA